jgi:hypothetical protein
MRPQPSSRLPGFHRWANFTGQKGLSRKDVQLLLLDPPGGPPSFEAKLKLKDYKLPEDALVFVEAYRQTQ